MPDIKLIVTSDGSHSLLNETLNETYHSVHGAIQESQHVFISNGLNHFLDQSSGNDVSVFEVGFGTGLNALLTLKTAEKLNVHIRYFSIEAFPIGEELWNSLNYAKTLGEEDNFTWLHKTQWEILNRLHDHFDFTKQKTTLQKVELADSSFDVIFYDAFAPNKQPEMWTVDMLRKVVVALKRGGVFVTYCAKGQLKRDLKELGLNVETLPGPPGKKEMVRGIKLHD